MTIAVPTSGGWTFQATLEEDEFQMLWLVKRGTAAQGSHTCGSCCLPRSRLAAGLWTPRRPSERLLEAHGRASGRMQSDVPGSALLLMRLLLMALLVAAAWRFGLRGVFAGFVVWLSPSFC